MHNSRELLLTNKEVDLLQTITVCSRPIRGSRPSAHRRPRLTLAADGVVPQTRYTHYKERAYAHAYEIMVDLPGLGAIFYCSHVSLSYTGRLSRQTTPTNMVIVHEFAQKWLYSVPLWLTRSVFCPFRNPCSLTTGANTT